MSDISDLKEVLHDDLLFQPSPIHQTLKSQFWTRFQPGPLSDKENITLATVQSYVSDSRLKRYWSIPGFASWFTNKEESKERIEYLWQIALDSAEILLRDTDPKTAGSKVQIMKLLAEVSGRLVKSQPAEKFSDESINKMSESELKSYLDKKGVSVKPRSTKKVEEALEEVFR